MREADSPTQRSSSESDSGAAGDSAPGRELARGLRAILAVIGVIVAIFLVSALLWFLSGAVTGTVWRMLIAGAMGVAIAIFGIGFFSQMAGAPPEPQPLEVPSDYRLSYLCEMCGMELSVVKVAKEKAPKHCGEEMVLVQRPAARPEAR